MKQLIKVALPWKKQQDEGAFDLLSPQLAHMEGSLIEHCMLYTASKAPGCPDIHQNNLAYDIPLI